MKKNVKRMSQTMSLGLCAALMATTALAASGTPYTGAAADITAPAGPAGDAAGRWQGHPVRRQ